jgi:hypothetical protein
VAKESSWMRGNFRTNWQTTKGWYEQAKNMQQKDKDCPQIILTGRDGKEIDKK